MSATEASHLHAAPPTPAATPSTAPAASFDDLVLTPPQREPAPGKAPKSQRSQRGQASGVSKHVSCSSCRLRKTRCDRRMNCGSCRVRGEPCIWDGAIPAQPSLVDDDFPEASTAAQREIARLRALVHTLATRLGVDPNNPSLPPLRTPSSPPPPAQQPLSPPFSALSSSGSSPTLSHASLESLNEQTDLPALPTHLPRPQYLPHSHPYQTERDDDVAFGTAPLLLSRNLSFVEEHSVGGLSGWYVGDDSTSTFEEGRKMWPGASFPFPPYYGAGEWDSAFF